MLTVLEVTIPVFALVFCGWIAARRRLLSAEGIDGINTFVFMFALPPMLFRAVSAYPLSEFFDIRFVAAYLVTGLIIFFGTQAIARLDSPDRTQSIGLAFAATHGNIGYLGLPLIAQLGDPRRLPGIAMALIVDIFVVIVMSIVLFEFARSSDQAATSRTARIRKSIIGLLKTPLILGIAAGLLFSSTGWKLPPSADTFVKLLGSAAGPCALFAIGASLGSRKAVIDRTVSGLIAIKLLVHPALMALAMLVFRVEPGMAAVGILAAGLPTASNAFILSQRYGVDTQAMGAAIVLGTFVAAASVSCIIWLLAIPIG
jgi:predicted permease